MLSYLCHKYWSVCGLVKRIISDGLSLPFITKEVDIYGINK